MHRIRHCTAERPHYGHTWRKKTHVKNPSKHFLDASAQGSVLMTAIAGECNESGMPQLTAFSTAVAFLHQSQELMLQADAVVHKTKSCKRNTERTCASFWASSSLHGRRCLVSQSFCMVNVPLTTRSTVSIQRSFSPSSPTTTAPTQLVVDAKNHTHTDVHTHGNIHTLLLECKGWQA